MKLFDIKVHTSDREYDVTLRNLTIIRASEIVHRISVAYEALLRSIKRHVIPGKLVIEPLIRIRSIKSLRQRADTTVDGSLLLCSRKGVTVSDTLRVSADGNISSMKKLRGNSAWRIVFDALFSARKSAAINAADPVCADVRIRKVRKRRLGELRLVRLADMEPMTLDTLDYVEED